MAIDYTKFAADEPDAAARAALYAHEDPLPSVPCSLLSSAEVHDYVRLTGMLHPFFPDALKSASYEAHVGGQFIWWDVRGRKHERAVARGDACVLPPNSITFVQVEPVFRLPDYIAVRFNLRITHVHRGLLLGTGPLVDPGFEGKLLIPLHNLTSSEYDVDTTAALIWIEFTKTTFGFRPTESIASADRHFVMFPEGKKNLAPDQYLRKASGGQAIRSSIPAAIEQGRDAAISAEKSARDAATTATNLSGRTFRIGLSAFAALVLAMAAIWYQVAGMVQSSIALSTSVEQGLAPMAADLTAATEKLAAAQNELDRLRRRVDQVSQDVAAADLKANAEKVSATQAELGRLRQQLDQVSRDLKALRQRITSTQTGR